MCIRDSHPCKGQCLPGVGASGGNAGGTGRILGTARQLRGRRTAGTGETDWTPPEEAEDVYKRQQYVCQLACIILAEPIYIK